MQPTASPDPPSVELPIAEELPPVPPASPVEILELPEEEPKPPVADAPGPPRHSSPLRLLASVAAAFTILFLFIRTFAVEPFGVPTGSMAPTLLGNHREAKCPRCGYPVRVGSPTTGDWNEMACPNCGKRVSLSQ